ncbi:MAG: alanine racemase [Chloroflexi bacterium]|nr:alanine racemase [Chloroflexota bacterium]
MISLYDILEASNGQLFGEPAAQIFTGFCLDSRQCKNAQLYVALRTDRGDTHQYMQEAVQNGALGLLCTTPPEFPTDGISVILVKNTETAMMAWASFILNKFGTQVVGVAGTSGKSVTIDLLARVLAVRYNVHHGESGAYRGRLALPLTLAKLNPDHRMVILELDATQPGEMLEMTQTVRPDVGVLTQTGYAYTDLFSSPEQITNELGVLLEHLQPNSLAVLNLDEPGLAEMAAKTKARVSTVGTQFGADLMAYNIILGQTGTGFDVRHKGERFVGRFVPLVGKQHLFNALSALAVGLYYNIPLEDGLRALSAAKPLPGRMNPLVGQNDCMLVDDSYSANPQSALAALEWLREATRDTQQRTIFVMSDMDHLGDYSKRGHRMIGQKAADFVDMIITEGTDAAVVGRAALDHGIDPKKVVVTYSIEDTIAALQKCGLTSNDVVLVKGGPSARMELVVKALLKNAADSSQLIRQDFVWESDTTFQPTRPSWLELDMDAMAANVQAIKALIGPEVALMAVVKADAYGHGAVQASSTALLNGADYLAVASMAEALELRDAGITAPILVLSYTPIYAVRQAIRQNITVVLYDMEMARAFDRVARELGGKLRAHVKVDTGMGRLGVAVDEAMAFFRYVVALRHIDVEGIYTHFSAADSDPDHTAAQVKEFKGLLKPLRASGFDFKYRHAANSAGTLASKDNHFNMVRCGIALYGISPFADKPLPPQFRPVMSWKTVVAQVRTLPPGHPVGYGNTYVTKGQERIAILPVGYADGFRRAPNHWGEVLIHGQRAPLVGRISMEKSAAAVTHIEGVSIGDEVVLLGKQGEQTIRAEDVAQRWGTIPYEVVTSVLARVPRR